MTVKRKIKSKKQVDREREIEREEKKKEFENQYYNDKKEWEDLGLDSSRNFDSSKEVVKRQLDEWECQRLKTPSGKYRDTYKIVSTYQQKFVEYVCQCCPHIIEELREFTPYFDELFGEQKNKYIDMRSVVENE
jgi:hypothetical protein